MDDIHVYLPSGMRVEIEQPENSFERCMYDIKARLQLRKWYGWKTVVSYGYDDVDVTELEAHVDEIICGLLTEYDKRIKRNQAIKTANTRLQTIFHGKVRDVKCPAKDGDPGGR